MEDTKIQAHITYKLSDILFMLICGMISGCTDLEMIIEFSEERIDFKFYSEVYAMFEAEYMDITDKDCEYEIYSTIEKGRGRIEKRTCYVLNEVEYFTNYLVEWKGLKKIFAVKEK